MTQRHPIQNEAMQMVTTVTYDRKSLFQNPTFAREAVEHLYRVQQVKPFFLYGFVIMPDHCHFLMRVPEPLKISEIMRTYKMGLAFQLGISKLWQPRFHIRSVENPSEALRYVHLNPTRKGLSEIAEDYPWSSASGKWDVSQWEL